MRADIKASLDAAIKKNAEQKSVREKKRLADEDERAKSLAQFKRLCAEVIRPVMDEFAARLKEAGHGVAIETTDEIHDLNGAVTSRDAISMKMYPQGIPTAEFFRSASGAPHITFTFDAYAGRTITIFTSNVFPGSGGRAGSSGTLSFPDVVVPRVEAEVLKAVQAVLSK